MSFLRECWFSFSREHKCPEFFDNLVKKIWTVKDAISTKDYSLIQSCSKEIVWILEDFSNFYDKNTFSPASLESFNGNINSTVSFIRDTIEYCQNNWKIPAKNMHKLRIKVRNILNAYEAKFILNPLDEKTLAIVSFLHKIVKILWTVNDEKIQEWDYYNALVVLNPNLLDVID